MFDARNPQDRFTLAGQRSPPVARFVGAALQRKFDVRRGYGHTGAIAVFRGRENVRFKAVFELATDQDWREWYAFKPLLDKDPSGTKPKALDITHALLEAVGINSVLIMGMTAPDQTDHGVWTIEVEMLQYRTPKLALAKPEGSQASPKEAAGRPGVDPVDAQLQMLTKEFLNELAGGT